MPDHTKALDDCFRHFKRNPNAGNWQRLTVAMFAHQQRVYSRSAELHSLVIDVATASDEQISETFRAISNL